MSGATSFFISGGQGFLGAWIARALLRGGDSATLFDLRPDDSILAQVLEPGELDRLGRSFGDVADLEVVRRALDASGAEHVIHLAGLQIPACRADPIAGARVNVLGTLDVLEAARRSEGRVQSVVYASSAAVAGSVEDYAGPIGDGAQHYPRTHYGVFKTANEGNARVYWLDHGVPSIGLRPLAVYGVGREIGVTSGPTKAIKAAILGRPYTIAFTGLTGFNYVEDVARIFIECARKCREGARALNLRGEQLSVEGFIETLEREVPEAAGRIRASGGAVPVAHDFLEHGLEEFLGAVPHTPVAAGIRRTADEFRRLHALGKLHARDLAS